ncbi:type II secretion system protein E, partial [Candidatus Saccharibacteria bacterium 32-45-3]
MAVLTEELQSKLEQKLVEGKILSSEDLEKHRSAAKTSGTPLFSELVNSSAISNEQLTAMIAQASNVPYVNLTEATIDQKVLALLTREVAEHYMAVPLGELSDGVVGSKRIAVAMIDANNVQAVDFLANKIQRPLKVYLASEQGIQHVLDQYKTDLGQGVDDAVKSAETEAQSDRISNALVIKTDSPISRALNTILEYAVRSRAS